MKSKVFITRKESEESNFSFVGKKNLINRWEKFLECNKNVINQPILQSKTCTMKQSVYIVCGGTSLKDFNFSRLNELDTIAVNRSAFVIKNPTYFITVDYIFVEKHWGLLEKIENTTKVFIANFGSGVLKRIKGAITDIHINKLYDLSLFDITIKSPVVDDISFLWNSFRSGNNSGFCAMQLAVLLGYKKIYLLGADMYSQGITTHFHRGYGEPAKSLDLKLQKYRDHFFQAFDILGPAGVEVISCSSISALNSKIPYIPFEKTI